MPEHSKRLEQLLDQGRAEITGRATSAEPDGVWMCAHADHPNGAITVAIPFASELDALRAANDRTTDIGRAVFVPYGKDLREVLNA